MGPTTEAAWNDLYNGVTELLGPERAETLMSHLFRYDPSQIAMKTDIARIESAIDALRGDIASLKTNLIGGLVVIVAAMLGILFAVL